MENERRHPNKLHSSYVNQTPSQLKLSNKASSLLMNDIAEAAQKIGATELNSQNNSYNFNLSQSNRLDSTERKVSSYNIGGGVLGQAKPKRDNSY
jgi:hypothetical protein